MKRFLFLFLFFINACIPAKPTLSPTSTAAESFITDSQMESAFAQARARLDEFIARIAAPNPSRIFVALKIRFTLPDGSTQDIWCDDVTHVNAQFTGNMGDDIPALKLAFGDRIPLSKNDIVDWMIVEDGKLIGGFTIRLAYSRMTPAEKQFFLNDAGYSLDE